MQVERVRASLRAEADDRARLSLQPAKIDIFIRVNARGHATPKRGAMLNNRGGKSTQAGGRNQSGATGASASVRKCEAFASVARASSVRPIFSRMLESRMY